MKSLIMTLTLVAVLGMSTAMAQSPHYINGPTLSSTGANSAQACADLAGLGSGTFTAVLTCNATITCTTRGNGNSTSANRDVTFTQSFTTHNGRSNNVCVGGSAQCAPGQITTATFNNCFYSVQDSSGTTILGPTPVN
jgi:hypothetical protein